MHDADIIELSSEASSPPPQPARTSKRHATQNKGKGKMKQAEVIELTDNSGSEFEVQLLKTAPSRRRRGPPTPPVAGPSKAKLQGKRQIIIDDDSDTGSVAAPRTRALAGPLHVRDNHELRNPKEHLPLNGENTFAGSSKRVFGGGNQCRADSVSIAESDTGPEVTRLADQSSGESSPVVGNQSMEVNPQIPTRSPSPTASPARIVLESSSTSVPRLNASSAATTPATSSSAKVLPPPEPLPPPPLPLVESPEETMSRYVAQVLEIVPDVDPEHCATLIADHQHLNEGTVSRILHILLEDPNYPRTKKGNSGDKGKRKADGSNDTRQNKKAKGKARGGDEELWMSVERPFVGGMDYHDLALNSLQQNYPFVPKAYLRDRLSSHKGFYAPTFFFLRRLIHQLQNGEVAREDYPFEPRKTAYRSTEGKGKGKQRFLHDGEFEHEMIWVKKVVDIEERREIADQNGNEEGEDEETEGSVEDMSDGEDENGVECGCCFSKFRFEKMIQCPDAHLFCISCLRSYASSLLGSHNSNITCMSQSSCTATFPASQLARVLPRKTYALYERLIQAKEIDAAGLEGLEECPFCEWKCVFDVGFEGEKLFRCGNDVGGCGVVSCRKCKKLDHLPKSCEEFENDKKLNARHLVEEAMTQALMRNCPKCKKAFIKESGCNKMTCPNCRTLSCYICRQIITSYEHFDQSRNPSTSSSSSKPKKCVLWDKDLDAFHANEVKLAADQAVAEAHILHPEVSMSDLRVDLPKAKPSNSAQGMRHQPMNPPLANVFMDMQDVRRVAAHRRRRTPPPIPAVAPPVLQLNANGVHRAARRNNGNGAMAREVQVVPVQLPAPQAPHVHVHIHQPPPEQHQLQQQLRYNPYHPIPQQQPPQLVQLAPPAQQIPVIPQPPYHQAVAQAMTGQYRPVGGGMEVGGRMLRSRVGRAEAVGNRPQMMGVANGVAAPEPGNNTVRVLVEEWMRMEREQEEQFLRQQQQLPDQPRLVHQQQQQEVQLYLLREQLRQRERQRAREARELDHERELVQPNLWAQQAGNIARRPPQQPEPEYQVVGQKRKRGHGG